MRKIEVDSNSRPLIYILGKFKLEQILFFARNPINATEKPYLVLQKKIKFYNMFISLKGVVQHYNLGILCGKYPLYTDNF